MSQSASQAHAFYRDVARDGRVWVLLDDGELPIYPGGEGDVTPVWSSESRAQRTRRALGPQSQEHEIQEMTWDDFLEEFGPVLEEEAVRLGVNWSGERARGYDMPLVDVVRNVEAAARG